MTPLPIHASIPDFLTPGLNGTKGLLRMHHRERKRLCERCALLLRAHAQGLPGKPTSGPFRCVYTTYRVRYMDWDNLCASFKAWGDALQLVGAITDDSPRVLQTFLPQQFLVPRAKVRTTITLDPIV